VLLVLVITILKENPSRFELALDLLIVNINFIGLTIWGGVMGIPSKV
jgi:hypothetical protein